MKRAWLTRSGFAMSIPREGLWIGRSGDCDLVLDDHRASQVHALLTWRGDRVELLALGRNPTMVNDAVVTGRQTLAHGDTVIVPGGAWTVEIPAAPPTTPWVAVLPSGERIGLGLRQIAIGGGNADDVRIAGWPANAVVLHRAPSGSLLGEATVPAQLDGATLDPGQLVALDSGMSITIGHKSVLLLALATDHAATLVAKDANLPILAHFRFTATGGVLDLSFAGIATRRTVDLPELRARLFAVLLAAPGSEVEDETVIRAVWPGAEGRTRLDLNQLVHRARKDLLAVGVDPTPILIRRRRGGAVQIRLAPGASVQVG